MEWKNYSYHQESIGYVTVLHEYFVLFIAPLQKSFAKELTVVCSCTYPCMTCIKYAAQLILKSKSPLGSSPESRPSWRTMTKTDVISYRRKWNRRTECLGFEFLYWWAHHWCNLKILYGAPCKTSFWPYRFFRWSIDFLLKHFCSERLTEKRTPKISDQVRIEWVARV